VKYVQQHSPSAPEEALDILEREIGKRVVITPELVDLNSILSVQRAAKKLKARLDRLDVLICNAGIGGWTGVDFVGAAKQFFTEGLHFLTAPNFKIGTVGAVTAKQITAVPNGGKAHRRDGADKEEEPKVGEVFCANLFGHYLLAHYLMPLLSRPVSAQGSPGRIIWVSTLEAYKRTFNLDDLQGLETSVSYESSKRLTDLLALTAGLTSSSPYTKSFFATLSVPPSSASLSSSVEDLTPRKASLRSSTRGPKTNGTSTPTSSQSQTDQNSTTRPKMYLSHPGMCITGIMPLHWLLVYAWIGAFYIVRLCGSPWHTITAYPGATSMTWLALAQQSTLDEMERPSSSNTTDADTTAEAEGSAKKVHGEETRKGAKWGSAVNRLGEERVRKSPVEGWLDDKGRLVKSESEKVEFEELGRECWKRMEELRGEWEERLREAGFDELS
jgi:3-keto steroid reductase